MYLGFEPADILYFALVGFRHMSALPGFCVGTSCSLPKDFRRPAQQSESASDYLEACLEGTDVRAWLEAADERAKSHQMIQRVRSHIGSDRHRARNRERYQAWMDSGGKGKEKGKGKADGQGDGKGKGKADGKGKGPVGKG